MTKREATVGGIGLLVGVLISVFVFMGSGFGSGRQIESSKLQAQELKNEPVPVIRPSVSPAVTTATRTRVVKETGCGGITVDEGDTLWSVAGRELNNPFLWPELQKANGLENPDLIFPGQKIILPCLSGQAKMTKTDLSKKIAAAPEAPRVTEPVIAETPKPEVNVPVAVTPVKVPTVAPSSVSTVPLVLSGVGVPSIVGAKILWPSPPSIVNKEEKKEVSPVEEPVAMKIPEKLPTVRTLPGSAWTSTLTSPVEKGNLVNYSHFDQGIFLGQWKGIQLEPYVAVNTTADTEGYSWNNLVKLEGGAKLIKSFSQGVVIVGGGWAHESRQNISRSGPIGYTSGWFGWDQPTAISSEGRLFSALPGSTWWTIGNTAPFEKNNVIGMSKVEQGVTVAKIRRISLIPTAIVQAGFDTDNRPWNNRLTTGVNLRIAVPWKSGLIDLQPGYQCVQQLRGPRTNASCGPTVQLNIWTGWKPPVERGRK